MAELDFTHNVSEVPEGQPLPRPFQRTESAAVTQGPDLQGAVSNYASATNWMSSMGSYVASKASNAIATQLGTELGKSPRGDIGIPLTEFDAAMQKSYQTQAQATLSLQASELVNKSNLEMAKAPRIDQGLIDKTNKSISLGLQNIFKSAPAEVKPQLEYQYGQVQLSQASDLTMRMIREQREDQKNDTAYSSQVDSENAYGLAVKGDFKGAQSFVESTKRKNESAVQMNVITKEMAKVNSDTARKSYLKGKAVNEYEKARAEGKGEEYLKNVADKADKGDPDYMDVSTGLMQYVNHQDAMRAQDQQLRAAKMNVSIAKDVMGITGAQMEEYRQSVSPEQFEKTQLNYINGVKSFNKEQGDINATIASWGDPAAFARAGTEAVNKGFDTLVGKYVQQRESQGSPVSPEEAEVQVAASAAGPVPNFVKTLSNKLNSGSPAQMDSAARQMDELYDMNAHHALNGLSDKDKAVFSQYKSLRDALPPEEAAKVAIQNANQDPDTQRMNQEKWASFVKEKTGGVGGYFATAPQDWALKQVGMSKDEFMNPGIANEYGNMILQKYAAYYQMTNGDKDNALKLTQQHVKENYGYTGVNGTKTKTLHPIEKVLGYDENGDVVPFIQADMVGQMGSNFNHMKEAFNKGESNVYWDVAQGPSANTARVFGHSYNPVKVTRYTRTGQGVKSDNYDVVLIGNSFNWDIALSTDSGLRPLSQIAPYLGMATYTPNKKSIDTAYLKTHGVR